MSLSRFLHFFFVIPFLYPIELLALPDCQDVKVLNINSRDNIKDLVENQVKEGRYKKLIFNLAAGTYRLKQSININSNACLTDITFHGQGAATLTGKRPANCKQVNAQANQSTTKPKYFCESLIGNLNIKQDYFREPYVVRKTETLNFVENEDEWIFPSFNYGRGFSLFENKGNNLRLKTQLRQLRPKTVGKLMVQGFFGNDFTDEVVSAQVSENGDILLNRMPHYKIRAYGRLRLLTWPTEIKSQNMYGYLINCKTKKCELSRVNADYAFNIHSSIQNVSIDNLNISWFLDGAISVNKAHHVSIKNVKISDVNGDAIRISGVNSGLIRQSSFLRLGGGAINVYAGNRQILKSGGFEISNNKVKDFSRFKLANPAIKIDGVGVSVIANEISNGPKSAIMFQGNDHKIERNNIKNVTQLMGDVGAIYTGRDWTSQGSVIKGNLIDSVIGVGPKFGVGIYIDDQASGNTLIDNNITNTSTAILVGGGRSNKVISNNANSCKLGLHFDARGTDWQRKRALSPKWDLKKRLFAVPYRSQAYNKYIHLKDILNDNLGAPKYNEFAKNNFNCERSISVSESAKPYYKDLQ